MTMKTKELIKELKKVDVIDDARIANVNIVVWHGDDIAVLFSKKATNWLEVNVYLDNIQRVFNKFQREYIASIISEYLSTPLDQRGNEKKYRVRLQGFNSDNGHQYLTADKKNVKAAKFFACAENPGLKQEFTQEELNDIANRYQFKGVGWLQDLIRYAEPVEEDD